MSDAARVARSSGPQHKGATDQRFSRLRVYNLVAAALHTVQAGVVLALSNDFALPVTGTYLAGPPGTMPQDAVTLFEIAFGPAVALFLLLAAVDHVVVAVPPQSSRPSFYVAITHHHDRRGLGCDRPPVQCHGQRAHDLERLEVDADSSRGPAAGSL